MTTTLPAPARSVPVRIWRNPRNGGRTIIAGHTRMSIACARDLAHALMAAADRAEADAAVESEMRLR